MQRSRMCRSIAAGLLLFWLAAPAAGRAEARVRVVATDPPGEAVTLGRDETFYLQIEYATDEPVQIWAHPYFRGEQVPARTNPSYPHAGTGTALGWFESSEPYQVDEVRIRLGGGSPYREWEAARVPLRVVGTSGVAATRMRAPWVDELSRQAQAAQQQDLERRMSEAGSPSGALYGVVFMLAVLAVLFGGVGLPVWAVWKWRGPWRAAAAVPLAGMAFVVVRILVDTARDPTSHNLWPFEILMAGAASLVVVGALALARRGRS
jgi:hypothetical protein